MRKVDHRAAQDPVGRQTRLIGVRAEHVHAALFLGGLEQPECRGIGVVVKHVCADSHERQGRFTAGGRIVEAVEVDLPALSL